ncbi:unnamed protein product [Rhizoctonia solani]|uniref:Uncharacterized protein n=1 Tax=Rhizoctonia solani TaxID=456999 RepID=A0A8H2WUA2_9AGAM|nr:unnamed protein product [Rhizoctonia solani]
MVSHFPLAVTRFLAAGLAGAVELDICTSSPSEENVFGSRKGVNAYSLGDSDDIDNEQESSGRAGNGGVYESPLISD